MKNKRSKEWRTFISRRPHNYLPKNKKKSRIKVLK